MALFSPPPKYTTHRSTPPTKDGIQWVFKCVWIMKLQNLLTEQGIIANYHLSTEPSCVK